MNLNEKITINNAIALQIEAFLNFSKTILAEQKYTTFQASELRSISIDFQSFVDLKQSDLNFVIDLDYKVEGVKIKNNNIELSLSYNNQFLVLNIDISQFDKRDIEIFIEAFSY